ncbi:ribokinase [soil metagenome]
MARVWVIGSLNVDRGWRVDRHPSVGETIVGEMVAPAAGGKGLNQAVAAVRMGADVVLVGRVGDDDDGRWLTALAAAEGIDVSGVATSPDRPTGSALIVVDAQGANTVTVDAGANATLVVGPGLAVSSGDVVVAQLEVPVDAVRAAFDVARAVGATSILNPSPIGAGRSLVPLADVVVVNQAEAAALAGVGSQAGDAVAAIGQALAIAAHDATGAAGGELGQTVVVTLGADGVAAARPGGRVSVPGIAAEAVDTTGAGDCFLGVLAAGLAEGLALEPALDRANRAAAVAVTRLGTVAAMPYDVELD